MYVSTEKYCFEILLVATIIVAPNLAIICYQCDSIKIEECAMTLNELHSLPYENCPLDLTCIMSIVDMITYRGCGQKTPTTGASYKKFCSSNLCNGGIFPPGRLKCHHCQRDGCIDKPVGNPRPCRYYQEEDQCYMEVLSTTIAYRGCTSDANHTIIGSVEYCGTNGCNDVWATKKLQCVQCNSNDSRGCKMDLFLVNAEACNITLFKTCTVYSLLNQKVSCYTYHKNSYVVRGCTGEMSEDILQDLSNVVECEGNDYCNAKCITRQHCLNCDSRNNEYCFNNTTKIKSITCGSAEVSSCYACEYDNWSVKRGCGKPPVENNALRCYECNNDYGCNGNMLSRCFQCTSDDGMGCATWEQPSNLFIEECQLPGAPCTIAKFQNSTTIRGCMRDGLNCTTENVESCKLCNGRFCNKGLIMEDSLWCHQCLGDSNCNQILNLIQCFKNSNDLTGTIVACFEFYNASNAQIARGCASNRQLYFECLLHNKGGCHLCHTNGCNKNLKLKYQKVSNTDNHIVKLSTMGKSFSTRCTTCTMYVTSTFSVILYSYIKFKCTLFI